MPRVQVYLPDDLYRQVKDAELSPSELLQRAVREELRHRELSAATDTYLAELTTEVGEPSPADLEWARGIVRAINDRPDRATG